MNEQQDQHSLQSSSIMDAPARNSVDRFAPKTLRPWLRLMRADRPIGIWLLLWPCWWSVALASMRTGEMPDALLLSVFALGAFVMRSAGCIYNDILDRNLDAQVERTRSRPLASGEISVRGAALLAGGCCLVGLIALLQFNSFTQALGFCSVGIVLVYPLMKRVTFWPQAVLGLAFSWGALMGWAALSADLALPPILLYFGAVFWTIGYDTIYAHQDREDDAVIGVKSTALLFGDKTRLWVAGFYALVIIFIGVAGLLVYAGPIFFMCLAVGAAHLAWQVVTLDVNDPDNCLVRFRSNHGFGAIIFIALTLKATIFALMDFLARSISS